MFQSNTVRSNPAIGYQPLHSYASKLIGLCVVEGDPMLAVIVSPGGGCIPLLKPRLLGEYFPSFALLVGEGLLRGEQSCPSSRTPTQCRARLALSLSRPPFARKCLRAACARNTCLGFALPYAWRSEVKQKSSMGEPSERRSFMNCSTRS